jgi:cell division protein FtsB
MLIVAVPICVLVALSFARILVADYQLHLQKQQLVRDVRSLQQENQKLQERVDYLQTDSAIEGLAREELGWTKPGDTSVVIVRAQATASLAIPVTPSPAGTPAT